MRFDGFDPKKMDEYSAQAKALYGKTDAYKEFEEKSKSRTGEFAKKVIDAYLLTL